MHKASLGERINSFLSPNSSEITNAVAESVRQVIAENPEGRVIVINNLTVNVQINAAQGGGATVNAGKM